MQLTDADVVLVTGGASGLGAATVESVLAAGARVVIIDLPDAVAALPSRAGVTVIGADVRDEEQVQAAVDAGKGAGVLRVVVNCAGVATPGRIVGKRGTLPLDDFRRVIDINLIGTFNVLRLAATAMLDNQPSDGDRGLIVLTASVAAYDGQIGQAAYAASKGGIVALTLSAARDLADKLVRVVTVAPGTFATPMLAGLPDEATAALEAGIPHPSRLGRPEEYAALVRHIVDNGMLNGEVIRLDGALRMPPR
jgi:NAD(P)-dependent dehydrogenase (short-subunit alcohol dehydrogenase family)